MAISEAGLSELLLKSFLTIHPWDLIKDGLRQFRAQPLFSFPDAGGLEVSFDSAAKGSAVLEDVLTLIDEKTDPDRRLIVVFEEFQEIADLEPGAGQLLHAILQRTKNISCLFTGREESLMGAFFEDLKSPFFHFGALIRLGPIPYEDFYGFLVERLAEVRREKAGEDARRILELTKGHPLCTRQLASVFWDQCAREGSEASVENAADVILRSLSASYQVIWSRLNRTYRRILEVLSRGSRLQEIKEWPASTVYSAAARLKKDGLVVRDDDFELEDPFFALWIQRSMQEAAAGIPPA